MTWKSHVLIFTAAVLMVGCARKNNHNEPLTESEGMRHTEAPVGLDLQSIPSHVEKLKALDWLVGNWVNKDENVLCTSSFKWDKNKNFLIQHFVVHVSDQKELEGRQIIGWDPNDNKIRSWTFDSDGGFGESTWSQDGASWYASMVYTLSDGRQASATHIYTKINDNTYTFASSDRDIDGKILPNIGPFTSVRQN